LRKMIAYGLFFLGVLLLGVAAFYAWHTSQSPVTASAVAADGDVPATVAGFALSQKQTGANAIGSIQQLQGSAFALTSGIVAGYGQNSALLWVAETGSESTATERVAAMEKTYGAGNQPFTPVGVYQFSGRDVYMLDGQGQSHFYFRSASKVVWLSVATAQAEQALKELLAFYP
jgi:hypothetical protein